MAVAAATAITAGDLASEHGALSAASANWLPPLDPAEVSGAGSADVAGAGSADWLPLPFPLPFGMNIASLKDLTLLPFFSFGFPFLDGGS